MNWFNWLKGKSRTPAADTAKVALSNTEKAELKKMEDDDLQQKLWGAESSSTMRSLIRGMTEQDLTDLVRGIALEDFPLNALASAQSSLDKRSTVVDFSISKRLPEEARLNSDG